MAKSAMKPGPSPVGKANMSGKGKTPTVKPMPNFKGGKTMPVGNFGGGSKK